MKRTYGYYTCKNCGSRHRAWIVSECYERKLCPKCIDKQDIFLIIFIIAIIMCFIYLFLNRELIKCL